MKKYVEKISVKKPSACTKTELQDFVSLVLAGGEVAAQGLEARINKAEALVFLTHSDCLKGIASVKNPETNYKNGVFQKARATAQAVAYPFELGWVFVFPSARGAGLSHKLVKAALSATGGLGIFATSRLDNAPMHKVLKAQGFSRHGEAYASSRSKHALVLFVRNASKESAPGDTSKAACS